MTSRGSEGCRNEDQEIPSWANVDFSELELGEQIGGGGVGIIYKGWWHNSSVALKTLFDSRISSDLKNEYMDELLVMSRVKHSNIVTFLGACMTPPNLCFIMELCDTSLFNMLHVDRVKMSTATKFSAAIDIASAMEYLHALSPAVIHRDLKTHNVLRAQNGSFKICDFGLVKNRNITAGTPAYMAPGGNNSMVVQRLGFNSHFSIIELLDNKGFNKPVDVYAFGVLLWEIFSEEIPFHRLDIPDIRQRVISGKRPTIPSFGFSTRLTRLINKCW
jgi:serine/threonine protein kinase